MRVERPVFDGSQSGGKDEDSRQTTIMTRMSQDLSVLRLLTVLMVI